MTIKPVQKPYPPLWYPSFSEAGVEYAAQHGFNFLSLGPPSLVTHLMDQYREISAANEERDEAMAALKAQMQLMQQQLDNLSTKS